MCAVSAVTDFYREKWPLLVFYPTTPPSVEPVSIPGYTSPISLFPLRTITEAEWAEYQELKRRMEEYDRRTGQPDCIKPEVAVWEAAIEAEMATNRVGEANDFHQ